MIDKYSAHGGAYETFARAGEAVLRLHQRRVLEIGNTHGYPTGAERESVELLTAAPLRCKPLKQWVSLNDVRFSPWLSAWPQRNVVLGVTEANRMGSNRACGTAERVVDGMEDAHPNAKIFGAHGAALLPVVTKGHIP
jgi:hypothetical protein